jgi:SOS-response transcriptional repressor LexA
MHTAPPIPSAVPVVSVPVLGRVPAGFPDQVPQDLIVDYVSLPDAPPGSYALVVRGESMSPTVKDGDYVLLKPREDVRSGDVVVVNDEWGETMLKRYREKDGEPWLVSDNTEFPAFRPNDHYRIMGKVVGVWRRVRI